MPPPETTQSSVSVQSSIASDGVTYLLTLSFSDDCVYTMTADEARDYAFELRAARAAGLYEAAVVKQLTTHAKMTLMEAAPVIILLRERRAQEKWQAGPMTITPVFGAATNQTYFECAVPDKGYEWQWFPADLKEHADAVETVLSAVSHDAHYRDVLLDHIGVDTELARVMVVQLSDYIAD